LYKSGVVIKKKTAMMNFFKRAANPDDVVGIDFGASGIKIVRLKRIEKNIKLLGAAILPPVSLPEVGGASLAATAPVVLDKALRGKYAAITTSSKDAILKLVAVPGGEAKVNELSFQEVLGVSDVSAYRIGFELVNKVGRGEAQALVAAIPEVQAKWLCRQFPVGIPAPTSVEVSGLAAMNSFMQGPGRDDGEDGVIVVDFGAEISTLAAFHKGAMVLMRQFGIGTRTILKRIQESFGVDEATATEILENGTIDASQAFRLSLEQFARQLVIARDFVERRQNCKVARLYASGGGVSLNEWQAVIRASVGLTPELWDPLSVVDAMPGAVSESVAAMKSRFAAAMGAAMSVLSGDNAS
jgi:Tfp pilus assembly PilM family ATPase